MIHLNINPSKEISSKDKPHVGTQVTKDGRLYGDKRCKICGEWITWVDIEPEYCFEASVARKTTGGKGTKQCEDFYYYGLQFRKKKEDEAMERAMKVMELCKKRGLIA